MINKIRASLIITTLIILFYSIFIPLSVSIAQLSERIDKSSDFDRHVFGREVKYDAYLLVVRRIENRKLRTDENYDKILSECTGYAFFATAGQPMGAEVEFVSLNGSGLTKEESPETGFKFYKSTTLQIDTVMNPRIDWYVKGNSLFPEFSSASMRGEIKFPDYYYIVCPQNSMVVANNNAFSYSVLKSNTEPVGFRLPPPDILQCYFYLPRAQDFYKEFIAINFDPIINATESSYPMVYPDYANTTWPRTSSGDYRLGQGSIVLKTYMFTDKFVEFPGKPVKQRWLFITVTLAEYPLTFTQ